MSKNKLLLMLILWNASTFAIAQECVKVRDGCMAFTTEEKHLAEQQGLTLGMPYSEVRVRVLRLGWKEKNDDVGTKLTCGSGLDATCSAQFIQNKKSLFLIFSKTNSNMPLVSVQSDPN